MSLFQHSVLNKYLQAIDEKIVSEAWGKFKTYFHNPEIQENIRNSKEEEYGGDFLTELFVNIFGYIKNPNPGFNLRAEKKNLTDAKKADGAIIQNEKVIGVIELKGMDTTDLGGKVEFQAFGYKNHQHEALYVITSNFEKLRFYIDNAVDFEEFNLFQLTQERFKILWLCLAKENVFKGIPKKIKDESLEEEELITKKLYSDYSTFKHKIFNSIVELNPQYNKLLLFKKTQKLLDRFLFILFAEDKGLLPPNSIKRVVIKFKKLIELDAYKSLYDIFKQYFGYLNIGRKGKLNEDNIEPYNGGLFKNDNILDNININDELLKHHLETLYNYDFESEVSVNILGHIFEHSLSEIEEITAELEGQEIDRSKSKRKKDGVYYTPKYITKYIVDNTVGKLCEEKKAELKIVDEEYEKERKGRRKTTLKTLGSKLEKYRNWLLELTICDPACGSGAFLIQALNFLISEHRYIDELNRKLLGHSIEFPNVEKSILENNLYGVDINDEAVEIAKLSLWLRTAHKGRKLTTLSNNIKCGNSLIDDVEIAGEKAFNWKSEFAEIFKTGGFDIVIGNPPYVPGKSLDSSFKSFVKNSYKYVTGKYDLYILFIEQILALTNPNGYWGMIIPNTILVNENSTLIRYELINRKILGSIRIFKDDVFPDASVESVVITSSKNNEKVKLIDSNGNNYTSIGLKSIQMDKYYRIQIAISDNDSNILDKISKNTIKLGEIVDMCIGIQVGGSGSNKEFKENYISPILKDDSYKKFLDGKDFEPYYIKWSGNYIAYGDWLHRKRDAKYFRNDKILIRQIGETPVCTIDKDKYFTLNTIYNLILKDSSFIKIEVLFALLNSKLIKYYWRKMFSDNKTLFPKIKKSQLTEIPIIENILLDAQNESIEVLELVTNMIGLNNEIHKNKNKFIVRLKDNFNIEKVSKKLNEFNMYDFSSVIKELKKQKITFSLRQQDEWSSYFEEYKNKINHLQSEIDKTDREIDLMVYKLYGLTEKEVRIVEGRV